MNKITIILKESGTIAELKKNFNIYQNSSQNVLLNILVPKPMVEGKFSAQFTNEDGQVVENGVYTAVKIGMVYVDSGGKYGKSETYFVRYLKEIKTSEGEFYVYERIMPSVFTRVAGVGTFAPKMVINVMNILNSQTELEDGTISENPTVLTLITTQECRIDIEPSTNLDVEPEIDATELELLEGQVNELTAEMEKKVDGDYIVQKYNLEEEIPEKIHYEKDGFKTKGVRFYNESFTVPVNDKETTSKSGEIYVSNVRQHGTELYWILQDEVFHYDTGIAVRTLVINAVQASINQYTTISVGEWQLINQDYINNIKSQADQNSEDIETLYRYYNTSTNYLGEYPSQSTLPTDSELNQYVQTNFNRAPQNGDELTFVLLVEDGTDVVYMIKYSEVKATWTETPLPSVEPAKNGTMGIIQGTGEEELTNTRKVLVDVNNGEINDILHANESGVKESISSHLNRNSQDIAQNASDIEAEMVRAESAEETLTDNLNAEISRATTAESTITDALNDEVTRATNAENLLETSIENETTRATGAENSIAEDLEDEITRAKQAEETNATAIVNEATRATNAENSLDTEKLDKDNINANYLKNIVFSVNGDSGVANLTLNNPVTGQTQSVEITVTSPASLTNTGLMTAEMVQALNNAIEDIESLKYIGKQIASFQTYADAELFDFSTISNINENDYFIVQADESRTEPSEKDKTTRYVCIDNTAPITIDSFQFSGVVDTVLIQVATEDELGGVLSTNTNGYIYVENTGAMKLVGYDNIISSISNLTTAISNETSRAEGVEQSLSQAITTETQRAQQAEQQNASEISAESTRAQQAEQANASAISAEKQRAQQAEQANATAIETKVDKTTTVAGKPLSSNVSLGTLTIKQNNNDLGSYDGESDKEINITTPTATSGLTNDGDGTKVNGVTDPYAKVSQIPTNNNQLTNGAGYAKIKIDTATNWETNNPVLSAGEFGYDSTNKITKIGDGSTAWNDLDWFATKPKPTFADSDWETINEVAKSGKAASYFNVGDEKTIELTTGEQVTVVILGFNHDDLTAGGKAAISIGMKDCLSTTYKMNNSDTNFGGWETSLMRTSTMATLLSQLPADLQKVVKAVNKKASAGNKSTIITTSSDKLWLFSRVEIDNTKIATYSSEGVQYDYWKLIKDGTVAANRIKKCNGSAGGWWLRSPYVGSIDLFCSIGSKGGVDNNIARNVYGVSFGFCI